MGRDRYPEPTEEDIVTLGAAGVGYELADAAVRRGFSIDRIKSMTGDELFDQYCYWHGLSDWGPVLRRVYKSSRKAKPTAEAARS